MVKQLAWLRRLPVDEAIWNEIRDLMNLQKSVQLGGAETRKKAIRYLLGRRRYEFWHRMGRLDQEETMGESVLPDEWAAVHYGWRLRARFCIAVVSRISWLFVCCLVNSLI